MSPNPSEEIQGCGYAVEFLETPAEGDLADIQHLYRCAGWWGDEPDDPNHIEALVRGSYCFAVTRARGRIIGMGRVISDGVSDGYIQDLTVEPDRRRRGVACAMMKAILDRLLNDGLSWVGLIAEKGSYGLYERFGFRAMEGARPYVLQPLGKN